MLLDRAPRLILDRAFLQPWSTKLEEFHDD